VTSEYDEPELKMSHEGGHVTAISNGRPPTRSAFDNDECHVTAFRPISEAAHSLSFGNIKCRPISIVIDIIYYTLGDSDVISFHIYATWLRRHLVGKTLRNVCYFDVI